MLHFYTSILYSIFHFCISYLFTDSLLHLLNIQRFCQICIQIIFFFSHRQIGKEHCFCTFIRIRQRTHQVNLTILQLFQQFFPVADDIVIIPSGIGRNRLLILIAIAAPASIFACDMIRIFISCRFNHF